MLMNQAGIDALQAEIDRTEDPALKAKLRDVSDMIKKK
jgi:hypothetical protein